MLSPLLPNIQQKNKERTFIHLCSHLSWRPSGYQLHRSAQKSFHWSNTLNIGKCILVFEEGRMICEHLNDQFNVEIIHNGQIKHIGFMMTPLMGHKKIGGEILIFQDITEQVVALVELKQLATHDSLSGVYNLSKLIIRIVDRY